MGSQCGRCLTRESEMLAEILLGKNQDTKENTQDTNSAIKPIKEEIPIEYNTHSNYNFTDKKDNNIYNSKYKDNQNK